jgi:hypothetical protein
VLLLPRGVSTSVAAATSEPAESVERVVSLAAELRRECCC